MTDKTINEELMLQMVRNTLLVAGKELGHGDHEPVVKATIHSLAKDWEEFKNKRAAFAELQKQCGQILDELRTLREKADGAFRAAIDKALTEMEDVYEASFAPVNPGDMYIDPSLVKLSVKRADRIMKTLEEAHDE